MVFKVPTEGPVLGVTMFSYYVSWAFGRQIQDWICGFGHRGQSHGPHGSESYSRWDGPLPPQSFFLQGLKKTHVSSAQNLQVRALYKS